MENEKNLDQTLAIAIFYGLALAAVGVFCRLLLVDWPNVSPVIALSIFIGYVVRDRRVAVIAIVVMMGVSDFLIGFYDWRITLCVYASLLIAAGTGLLFQSWIDSHQVAWKLAGVVSPALIGSVVFFLITNAACCLVGWYPFSWSGLTTSLSAGLPFFRSTLSSTVLFSVLFFGLHFAVKHYLESKRLPSAKEIA